MNEDLLAEFLFNVHDSNSIVTGGDISEDHAFCPVRCNFCMSDGDNPLINSKIPYITDEQLELGIKFVTRGEPNQIMVGDGITRLSAEPFAHPRIYEILERVCGAFPEHEVKALTTGVLINKQKIEFLNNLPNMHLSISVNSLDDESRQLLMPNPQTEKIKLLVAELDSITIELFDMGSTEILKRDIEAIEEIETRRSTRIRNIQLRRIEHSRFHNQKAVEMSRRSISNYATSVRWLIENRPHMTYWSPYLKLLLASPEKMEGAYMYLAKTRQWLDEHNGERVLLCFAESSFDVWDKWLRGLEGVTPVNVKNHTYGGSVTVAGLMTFDDIARALKEYSLKDVDWVLVPRVMLNTARRDLLGVSIVDFASKIGVRVEVPWN